MRCIVGLGNPGKKYFHTRHNAGFIVLDRFAEKYNLSFSPSKKDYYISEGTIVSSDFFLIKPVTFMNLSGSAVLDFLEDHNVELQNILVVYDDVNLPLGKIRLRKGGSDGGHNGIKSIIYNLQSDQFPRLRFGIGNDFQKGEMADYVLSKFENEEMDLLNEQVDFAVELVEEFLDGGYKLMTDLYSKKSKDVKEDNNDETEKG